MTNKKPRIDKKDITEGAKLVIDKNLSDRVFLDPNSYILTEGTSATYSKYYTPNAYVVSSEENTSDSSGTANSLLPTGPISSKLDVPELTDIENISYEQYYDPISKLAKYKATIKIRNSSKNPNSVAGVDARIYNPNA